MAHSFFYQMPLTFYQMSSQKGCARSFHMEVRDEQAADLPSGSRFSEGGLGWPTQSPKLQEQQELQEGEGQEVAGRCLGAARGVTGAREGTVAVAQGRVTVLGRRGSGWKSLRLGLGGPGGSVGRGRGGLGSRKPGERQVVNPGLDATRARPVEGGCGRPGAWPERGGESQRAEGRGQGGSQCPGGGPRPFRVCM